MATGDQTDFVQRLQAALPLRWFPNDGPVLNGVLSAFAAPWAALWQNLQFVIGQTRIASASGPWLDAVAADFFGDGLARYGGEADAVFRTRILAELFRVRGTRAGLAAAMQTVTGGELAIYEFNRISDTGGLGSGGSTAGLFYGAAGNAIGVAAGGQGGWGSLSDNFQAMASIPVVTDGPGVSVQEICAEAANVLPCCGVLWLNAYDGSDGAYLASASSVNGVWTTQQWNP